jgi:hypothetical protein
VVNALLRRLAEIAASPPLAAPELTPRLTGTLPPRR